VQVRRLVSRHSGWAAAVVVCGPLDSPVVVDRKRNSAGKDIQLYLPAAISHRGKNGAPGAAKFIREVQTEDEGLAVSSLAFRCRAANAAADFRITRGRAAAGLWACPSCSRANTVSHALIHTRTASVSRRLRAGVFSLRHSGGGHPGEGAFRDGVSGAGIQEGCA